MVHDGSGRVGSPTQRVGSGPEKSDPWSTLDTIRDDVLTCARKPTRVGLIYRTETTTKNCKTEKLEGKNRYARSNSKSLENHVVSPEEETERLRWEGFAEKKALSLE